VRHAHEGIFSAIAQGKTREKNGRGKGRISSAAPSATSPMRLEEKYRSCRARYSKRGCGTGKAGRRSGWPPWRMRRVYRADDRVFTLGPLCSGSAMRPQCQRQRVTGAVVRQCDSRTGGCAVAVLRVGRAAIVMAAAGQLCSQFGGVGTSVIRPLW